MLLFSAVLVAYLFFFFFFDRVSVFSDPLFVAVGLFLGRFAVGGEVLSDNVSVSWPLLVKLTPGVFRTSTVTLRLCDSCVPSGSSDPVCFQSSFLKLELLDSFCFT